MNKAAAKHPGAARRRIVEHAGLAGGNALFAGNEVNRITIVRRAQPCRLRRARRTNAHENLQPRTNCAIERTVADPVHIAQIDVIHPQRLARTHHDAAGCGVELHHGTLGQDGDPLDALVCLYEPTFPGCLIPVKPVGMFMMRDEKGIDDKIICVPLEDPYWNEYQELEDLPVLLRQEIEQFFSIYKDLEGKAVTIDGWHSRAEAEQEIAEARERLRDS